MQKTYSLFIILPFFFGAFAQKRSNPKIGKNETEITSFVLSDYTLAVGGQMAYRFSLKKNTKLGVGALYAGNYDGGYTFGYGAVLADIMQFIGSRQKWGIGGQLGPGVTHYNEEATFIKLKGGVYYSISVNYRAIISRRVLIITSLFFGHRYFYYDTQLRYPDNNSGFLGLKAGVVF